MRIEGVRRIGLLAGALLLLTGILLAGCSSGSGDRNDAGAGAQYNAADTASVGFSGDVSPGEAAAVTADSEGGSAAGSLAGAELGAEGRKIVYRGTVTLETEDFAEAQTALMNAVHQSEAYILTFEDSITNHEIGARYTIKVPADGFASFLDRIGAIPNTFFERRLSGTDVTEEFVDLEARLGARQAAEARLLDFMSKAQRADDLVSFSRQLADVQEEIERIKGRIRYLNQNVAYSTVELRLYQPLDAAARAASTPNSLGERMTKALKTGWNGSVKMVEGLLVIAAGLLPVAAVLAVPAAIYLAVRKRRRRNAPAWAQPAHAHHPFPHIGVQPHAGVSDQAAADGSGGSDDSNRPDGSGESAESDASNGPDGNGGPESDREK